MMHIRIGVMSVRGYCRKMVVLLSMIGVSVSSFAATYTWTGGANDGGKWSTPANWGKTSGYPGSASGDTANIGIDAVVDLDVTPTKLNYLKFPLGAGASVRVNGNGKTIAVGTQMNFGSESATSTSFVVLDNLKITFSGSAATTVYKNTKLTLENNSKISAKGFLVNPPCSVTIDDSTQDVTYIQVVNGTNYKSADFFIRGTHPLLKVSSDDGTGSVYTKTGKYLSFYFDIPKGGYVNEASGSGYAPIQVNSTTKKFLAGSASGTKLNFYVAKDSEALTMPGTTTYTLVSATAGSATDKATLNDIVPTEDSKTSATLAWENETVEDVTTVGKYLKATIDVPKPKGLVIMFY